MKRNFKIPDGRLVQTTLRNMHGLWDSSGDCNGCRLKAKKKEFGFFVFEGSLYVFIDNSVLELSSVTISNEIIEKKSLLSNQKRILRVCKGKQQLICTEYKRKKKFDNNPFWPTDEEDADFYLWISNVLNDPERVQVLLEVYSGNMEESAEPNN